MSFTVNFYTFSKRVNSTARPTGTGTSYNITLKQPTSIIAPVLELNANQSSAPKYNYCKIAEFDRWYWIRNWTWERGLWVADLAVDPLASWRTEIGASSNYVTRSSYEYDGAIMDNYYPVKAESSISRVALSGAQYNPWWAGDEVAVNTFILGVINNDTPAPIANRASNMGAITYYAMTYSTLRSLLMYLLGDISYMNISDIGAELAKGIINPFDYIVSCMYYPFPLSNAGIPAGSSTPISVGWWTTNINANYIGKGSPILTKTSAFTVPKHPQAATRGKYCNMQPFSRYSLIYGPFGEIPIDTSFLQDCSTLNVKMDVDIITGAGKITLSNTNGDDFPIIQYAQIGVPIQLAQISTDIISTMSHVIGSVGSFMTGNVVGGLSGIVSAAGSALPQGQTQGGNGTTVNYYRDPELIGEFFSIVSMDNDEHGRPLCARRTISSVPGYLVIESPQVSAPATAAELEQILGYMAGGFYYE